MSEDNKSAFQPQTQMPSKQADKPVSSPCVNICSLDEQDICSGCYRTADEIFQWGKMDDNARRQVLKNVAEREASSGSLMKF